MKQGFALTGKVYKKLRGAEEEQALEPVKDAELELAYKCLAIIEDDLDLGFDVKDYHRKSGVKRLGLSSPDHGKRMATEMDLDSHGHV